MNVHVLAANRADFFLIKRHIAELLRLLKLVRMGKADFLSPKAIANRIKSKGLQKLRWYCQMCQKQCRDEVGCSFKQCYFRLFVAVVYVLALFCLLGSSTERFQVSLHVRVPPEAAAPGLRKPQQVHGLFLRVSSLSCEGVAETWRCCTSH